MTVEWHDQEWRQRVLIPAVNYGLAHAAIELENQMRRGMGSEGGGVLRKASKRKNAKGVFVKNSAGKGRNIYFAAPPGAYPGVRTGLLRRSINFGRSSDGNTPGLQVMRVGTRVAYGRYLERGTSSMAARPWAMKSVGLSRDRMMKTFARVASQQIGRKVVAG